MNALVRLGRPRTCAGSPIRNSRNPERASEGQKVETEAGAYEGEFDRRRSRRR